MTRREGVSSDEIRAFMCVLIKAFRRPGALWSHHCEAFTGNKAPAHVVDVCRPAAVSPTRVNHPTLHSEENVFLQRRTR